MEEPFHVYKNHLRNSIIIAIWIMILSIAILLIVPTAIFLLSLNPNWNPEWNLIVIIGIPTVAHTMTWRIRITKLKIYNEALVFTEYGPHPLTKKEFGILFENIINYRSKKIFASLNQFVFIRQNGKSVERILSLPKKELKYFTDTLNKKIKNN